MRARRLCLAGMLFLWLGPGLYAQGPPADTLMERWLHAQRQAWSRWQALRVTLEIHRKLDSPFGVRRWQIAAEAYLEADVMGWQVRSLDINNRIPTPPVPAFAEAELHALAHVMPLRNAWTRWLAHAPAIADTVEAAPCWRVELHPPGPSPAERATLWFAQQDGRLLQSRLLVRWRPAAPPRVILTRFTRLHGLDLPQYRYIEWMHPMRRRMRRYTMLITQEVYYRDYRLEAAGTR